MPFYIDCMTCRRIAGGNEPASGIQAMKQLYASGMAGIPSGGQSGVVSNSHRGLLEDEIEEEYLPKKAAAPEVRVWSQEMR